MMLTFSVEKGMRNRIIPLTSRIITITLSVMICYQSSCLAAFTSSDVGTTTAQFLTLGAGARATAMGNAYTALSDDATAVYWNPAGLSQITDPSLSVMHAAWFGDIYYDWASYVLPIRGVGTLGIGVQYLNAGTIQGADINNNPTNSFTPNDTAVTLSYSRNIAALMVGVNLKYITSTITNSASAVAGDIGVLYKASESGLSVGACVQNAGTAMQFSDQAEQLPLTAKAGCAYSLESGLILSVDIDAPIDNAPYFCGGTEYTWKIDKSLSGSVRVGYTTLTQNVTGFEGISGGVGCTYKNYSLDYAFMPYGDLGSTNRISLGIKF
jgi:hypothetical protein